MCLVSASSAGTMVASITGSGACWINRMLYGIPEGFLLSVAVKHNSSVVVAPVDPAIGRDRLARAWT